MLFLIYIPRLFKISVNTSIASIISISVISGLDNPTLRKEPSKKTQGVTEKVPFIISVAFENVSALKKIHAKLTMRKVIIT